MLSPPAPRGQGRSWPEKQSPSGTFRGADVKGSCPRSSPEAQPGWVAAAGQDRPRLQQLQRRTGSSSTVGSALPKCRAKAPPWSLVAVRPQVQLPHGRAVLQQQAEPCSALCPPGACCHAVTELGLSGLWKSTVSPADLFLVPRPCFALGFQAYGLPSRMKETQQLLILGCMKGFIESAQIPPRPLCGSRAIPAPSS